MEKHLHYKDIGLVPRYSTLNSRSQADASVVFLDKIYKSPVIPANMATTVDFDLALTLSDHGYFYILHRFYDYREILLWIRYHQTHVLSISVGVQERDKQLIREIAESSYGVDYITIDVAHGFHARVKEMIDLIKKELPHTKIIAGNVFGDRDSIEFLQDSGADAIKVGLSFGAGCSTFEKTSFCSPLFSCGLEAAKWAKVPLIGDGGIKSSGDIVKGLRAGYSMIMAGSIFAACNDSPAPFVNGKKHYYGSASAKNKGHNNHVEGREILLDCNNLTYLEKMDEIKQNLQSAISYAGGYDLSALKTIDYFIL